MDRRYFSLAEKTDGFTIMKMRKLAEEHGIVLVCPIFEMEGNLFYNSAVVIDADGDILGSYRKIHVPQIPLWEERYYFSPGNHGFPVFETKFAPIGVQICWDNFFPEGSRILALKGAKIIFSPTAAAFASQRRWETVISSNAIANGVYVFRVNRVGSEERQDFYGRSFCISPEGELLDKPTGMKDSITLIEIELKNVDKARKEWPFFKDRRPEVYKEITESIEQSA
jgi:N-carbamoylputrescine amidase